MSKKLRILNRLALFTFAFCLFTFCLSCEKDFSPVKIIAPPDTTSHNFMWQEYTFGTEGSYFKDVIAVNQNDVWAVGAISIRDTNGILTKYNAVHSNGQDWRLKRIFNDGNIISPVRGIWIFSHQNIWLAAGSIFHYDGQTASISYQRDINTSETAEKLWASSEHNIFGVGNEGLIVHYDGSGWQKLQSGTTVNLTDIWGSGPDNIWVCGHETSENASILLHFDGNSWQKVWETGMTTPQYPEITFLHSLWFQHSDTVVIVGNGIYYQPQDNINAIRIPENDFEFFQFAVRGSAYNNLFVAGDNAMLWHFNGIDWKFYSQLFKPGDLAAVAVSNRHIFAVGERYINPIVRYALIYHGIQK